MRLVSVTSNAPLILRNGQLSEAMQARPVQRALAVMVVCLPLIIRTAVRHQLAGEAEDRTMCIDLLVILSIPSDACPIGYWGATRRS